MNKLKIAFYITVIICALTCAGSVVYVVFVIKERTNQEQVHLNEQFENSKRKEDRERIKEEQEDKQKKTVLLYIKQTDVLRTEAEGYIQTQSLNDLKQVIDEYEEKIPPEEVEDYHQHVIGLYCDFIDLFTKMNDSNWQANYNNEIKSRQKSSEKDFGGGKYGELAEKLYGPNGERTKQAEELFGPIKQSETNYAKIYLMSRYKYLSDQIPLLNSERAEIKEKYLFP